jgi:hypothetical protein
MGHERASAPLVSTIPWYPTVGLPRRREFMRPRRRHLLLQY